MINLVRAAGIVQLKSARLAISQQVHRECLDTGAGQALHQALFGALGIGHPSVPALVGENVGNFGILQIETGDAFRAGAVNENHGMGRATFAGIVRSIFVEGRDTVNVEFGPLTEGARQGGLDVQEGVLPLDANRRAFPFVVMRSSFCALLVLLPDW